MHPTDILSRRELQVAERYATGESFRDIADSLGLAPATVRTHLTKIYRKLGVSTKVALVEALRDPAPEASAASETPEPVYRTPARRHTVTVAYLYIEGFTEIARAARPEDLRSRTDHLRQGVAKVATAKGAEFLSHGGGAYALVFGYPTARETDAESAARAAVELRTLLAAGNGTGLRAKIAVLTGHVVVPARAAGAAAPKVDQVVAGTVDLASEMARQAETNQILVCPRTRGALPFADFDASGDGGANAVLVRLREQRTRIRHDALPDSAAFVGRRIELDMLAELYATCRDGFGQAAQIVGDAGIGKSRLIQEFLRRAETCSRHVLTVQCEPTDRTQPFAPIRRHLLQTANPSVPEAEALRGHLSSGSIDPVATEIAIGEILGDPALAGTFAARSSAELRRARTFDVLDAMLRRSAGNAPLVVAFEDVHWADPTSREWLDRLSRTIGNVPILLLTTSRPVEGSAPLTGSDIATLTLRPLKPQEAEALIVAQPGSSSLSGEARIRIARKAEGVPLFLEELLRASIAKPGITEIPDTMTGAIRARFDAAGVPSTVVEAASVLGRSFEAADVAAILETDVGAIAEALDHLCHARVINLSFGGNTGQFQFRHDLLRDFAYAQLTHERLVSLHKLAARVLSQKAGTPPVLIAEHMAAAGQVSQATRIFLEAAEIAVGRAANREVIDICERAIALTADILDLGERIAIELNARILMGVAMQALYGYSAASVLENYRRARELCELAGARTELFPVLRGLYVYNLLAGNLREADRLALQLVDLADRSGEREHFIESRFSLGQIKIWHRNDIAHGLTLLRAAAARYKVSDSARHVRTYGQDPGVFSQALSLFPLIAIGRFDEARQAIHAALDLADQAGHPMSRAAAALFSSWAAYQMDDPERALIYAAQARELGRQQLLPTFEFSGEAMHSAATGDVAGVTRKLGFYDAVGMKFSVVIIVPILADRALAAKDVALADMVIRRALDLLASGESEPCMSAEAYRIAARVDHARGETAARDAWLDQSWSAAAMTGSHFFALRTAADAMTFGLASESWSNRMANAMDLISPQLPNRMQASLHSRKSE